MLHDLTVYCKLFDLGAHLVPLDEDGRPLYKGWPEHPWSPHLTSEGETRAVARVGLVVASVDCANADIDVKDLPTTRERKAALPERAGLVSDKLGMGACWVDTPSGGGHIWYRVQGELPEKHRYELFGGDTKIGDLLIGDRCFAALHDPERVLAMLSERGVRRMERRWLLRRLDGLLRRPESSPRGGVAGGRNNALYAAVFGACMRGDVDEAGKAVQVARDAGLPEREIRDTFASAERGAAERTAKDDAECEAIRVRMDEERQGYEEAYLRQLEPDAPMTPPPAPKHEPIGRVPGKPPKEPLSAVHIAWMMLDKNVEDVRSLKFVQSDKGLAERFQPWRMKRWKRGRGWVDGSIELPIGIGCFAVSRLGYPDDGTWKTSPVKAMSRPFALEVMKALSELRPICTLERHWDAHSHLVTHFGTVWDLLTGKTVRSPRDKLMRRQLGARPANEWGELQRVLEWLVPDQVDREAMVRWLAGALFGVPLTRRALVLLGPSGTWKSTLLEAVRLAFGELAGKGLPELVVDTGRRGFTIESAFGQLGRVRLAIVGEMPVKAGKPYPFAPDRFLPLTGGEGVEGRQVGGDTVFTAPSLAIGCNALPLLPGDENTAQAVRERLQIVRFECEERGLETRQWLLGPEARAQIVGLLMHEARWAYAKRHAVMDTPRSHEAARGLETA